jgi:perosamine synthetase
MHYYFRSQKVKTGNFYSRSAYSNNDQPFGFSHGRTALKYGLISLKLDESDIVLLPEYICDVVINPFNELKINYEYYDVNDSLEPIWSDVLSKIRSNTKAIMIVHYFGQPQDITKAQNICTSNNLLLIEDNAHGHGSMLNGKMIGTYGDMGFSSPRKNYPVLNGGYLFINDRYITSIPKLPLQPINRFSQQLKVLKHKAFKSVSILRRFSLPPRYDSQETIREGNIPDWGMDKTSHYHIENGNIYEIRKKRREIYHIWYEWALTQNLKPLFKNLDPGSIPLLFPAYSRSYKESKQWYILGHEIGIDIHSWPTLPKDIAAKNGKATLIWERLICFPIHVEMESEKLKEILRHIHIK